MSSMAEGTISNETDGSGGGLIAFLSWTIDKNELVDATASALRTGCLKVLSAEEDWQALDLRTADLDGIVNRFKIKHRMDMKDRTREQYEQRFRQSVEMYLKWLGNDPTWKPAQRKKAASTNSQGNKPVAIAAEVQTAVHTGESVKKAAPRVAMITYPFPIRPGLRGKIELPEDMTAREASRIAAFIATLAVEEAPAPVAPLAIESGKEPDARASGE